MKGFPVEIKKNAFKKTEATIKHFRNRPDCSLTLIDELADWCQ